MSFCTVPRAAAAIFLCFFSTSAFAVQPLEITEAFTQAADADAQVAVPHEHLVVIGSNFLNGGEVELALGGFPLTVISQSDSEVVAELPDLIDPGNYQLVVTTGGGTVRHDDFDGVTIGAVGPQGPKGDKGEKGDKGDTGAPGTDGQNGANCYDGIGTSVADCIGAQGPKGDKGDQGEQGPQGPPGADGTPGIDGGPGLPGQSVIADLLPAGSTECPYGGTKFTSVSGINFACNGAPGPQGQSGNLALAGLACPTGQFVIGFDSLGNLQCASVDDTGTQTGPTVTQVPPFGGDLLALEFSGTVSVADTTGDYAEFDGGSAIGTIIADFTCASSNLINTGSGGRVYSFFGPGAGCGEWDVSIVSPTGTTQSLSLNLFVIEVVWDTDLQTFPGGWIRIGNSDSSIGETRTFDMFTAEPLPDGAQLPSSEFLNDSDNFSGIAFNVQDHQIGGLLLTVSGPDFSYAFTEVNTAACAEGETQTAECSTVVEPPFQVCQDGTRTRTCLAGGTWGQWGSCSGAIVSDPSGTCP